MKFDRHRTWYLVRIWGFVFIALLAFSSSRSTHANSSVTLYYTIDRSQVPELTYNDLTLKVDAGNITDAQVSTLNGTPIAHTYDAATGEVIFTTDAEQVEVVLNGVADPNSVGNFSKATLKEDKKWAWSIGLDDNTLLQPAIDLLNAKGWAGTMFMIGEKIDDTRDEDWIIDAPDLHNLLDQGWSVGNHTWGHECFGDFDYEKTILDGNNRLQEVVDSSPKPDYKLISFAAPCFNANYHGHILNMRDNGQTAVQFNESGNDYMLIVDSGQTSDFSANGITASAFDFDMAVGRDSHIEYDVPYVLTHIDWMAAQVSPNRHFWYNNLSHGNNEVEVGQVVDYVYTTYGPAGTDEAWVAPSDVIYSYLLVRDNSVVTLSNGSPPPPNTAPSVTNPGEQNNTEGDIVSLTITANDADGDTLAFSATGLPTGLSINANTGAIFGILLPGSANTYNTTVTVTDGTEEVSSSFAWNVNALANLPPLITNPGDQNNQEGDTLSLTFSGAEAEGDNLSLRAAKQEGDSLNLIFSASDPEGDELTFNVTGLPAGLSIYSDAGTISGTIGIGTAANSPYSVTISVNDGNGGTHSESFTWDVDALPAGEGSGQILHEQWNGVAGNTVETLTTHSAYPDSPDVQDHLSLFEISNDTADAYGTRIRGYIHPPVTGEYRFWMAADDMGELWLSSDDLPDNSALIASVPEITLSQEWDKNPLQESTLITLQAGTRYYIEALHKEDSANDHLAVAWQIPGGTREVIDGQYLSPYEASTPPPSNREPSITNPDEQSNFTEDHVSLQIIASDPDGDALTYSATALPDGLSIDESTGMISGTIALSATVSSPYSVTVSVDDAHGGSDSQSFLWSVNDAPTGGSTGQILHERWDGIFGGSVVDLTNDPTYPNNPDIQDYLTTFEIPTDVADIYGSRVRGYIHAPVTGEYRFWLASDDGGELFLSTDDNPNNASLIAFVSDWSPPHAWDNNPSQESAPVTLQAGERYYIEALHKEAFGGDHLAVAWQIPAGTREVIDGQYLSAYDSNGAPGNNRPSLSNPGNQSDLTGDNVSLSLSASDADGDTLTYSATGLPVDLSLGSIDGNSWQISGTLTSNSEGTHNVTVSVDDGNGGSDSQSFTWSVMALPSGNGTGQILRERWDGIFGGSVVDLTNDPAYPNNPDLQDYLTSFEILSNADDIYGTRVRGYIHAPVTGEYRFWLASDDGGELLLSTDDNPNNATLIASVSSWSSPHGWDDNPSQESAPVTLQAGERYYIEALHKEAWGGDHLAVAWEIPGSTREVIAGQYLSAYDPNGVPSNPTNQQPLLSNLGNQSNLTGDNVSLSVSASDADGDTLSYSATGLPADLSLDSIDGNSWQISGTLTSNSEGIHNVTVSVDDGNGGSDSESFTWSVTVLPSGNGTGQILRERWDGIFGGTVVDLTNDPAYPDSPTIQDYLTAFEIPSNVADIYGTRVRGYIHAPVTGEYRFWLASDDGGELLLSTDDNPNNATLIASVSSWSAPRGWDDNPSQKSAPVTLQAGERYYIEALHKEAWGGDHLAVAWEIPGSTREVIAGQYLSAYDPNEVPSNPTNEQPSLSNPGNQSDLTGNNVFLSLSASDADGDTLSYSATGLPVDLLLDSSSGQISGTLTINSEGTHSVTVTVDDGNGGTNSQSFTWNVIAVPSGNSTGVILRERWDGIFGQQVTDLINHAAYPNNPDLQDYLTSFEIPSDAADFYGTRIRGYIEAPVTGQYRFWLASDNSGELWLSSDDQASNATLIASVSGWTPPKAWDHSPSQESVLITLQEGERYYVETIHKEQSSGDHLAVAWEIPGNTRQVIDGQYLSPYDINSPSADQSPSMLNRTRSKEGRLSLFPSGR